MPVNYLEFSELKLVGFVLLLVSFIWTSIGQYQMSKSWRIGINYNEKTELVSKGLFNYSRNPIFLGVLISYLGTFLIIPNILSFAIMLVTYVTIQTQVRMEEEYLENVQGVDYFNYKLKSEKVDLAFPTSAHICHSLYLPSCQKCQKSARDYQELK